MTTTGLRSSAELLSQLTHAGWSDVVPRRLLADLDMAEAVRSAAPAATRPPAVTARALVIGAEPGVARDTAEAVLAALPDGAAQVTAPKADGRATGCVPRVEIRRCSVSGAEADGALLRELLRDTHFAVLAVRYEALTAPGDRDRRTFAALRPWFAAVLRYCGPDQVLLAVVSLAQPASSRRNRHDWVWRQICRELRPGPSWPRSAVMCVDAVPAAGPGLDYHGGAAGRWQESELRGLRSRLLNPIVADPSAWLRASVTRRLRAACDDLCRLGTDILSLRSAPAELDPSRLTDPDYAAIRQTWLVAAAIVPFVVRLRAVLDAAEPVAGDPYPAP